MSELFWVPSLHGVSSAMLHARLSGPSSIGALLSPSGPADIARLVMSTVVNAIERQIWRWTAPDILKKRSEALVPSLADLNASASVVWIRDVFAVVAPLFHGSPNSAFWGRAQAMSSLARLASTGRRRADAQVSDKDLTLDAAHAAAEQVTHTDRSSVAMWAKHPRSFFDDGPMANDRAGRDRPGEFSNMKGHRAQL